MIKVEGNAPVDEWRQDACKMVQNVGEVSRKRSTRKSYIFKILYQIELCDRIIKHS